MSSNDKNVASHAPRILLLLFLVQVALCLSPGTIAWDGAFYHAYTRSAVFDGDLSLGNDLRLSYAAYPNPHFEAEHLETVLTPTGRVDSPFAIGTSLLWLPWFVALSGLVRLAGQIGSGPTTLTGYEWPFVWGMAAVTCVYGWISILVGFRLARRFTNDWGALLASATAMFATPLIYYQFREPFYAHAASAMTTALFVSAWYRFARQENHHPTSALLLGTIGGLAALVRPQNITYLILPALTTLGAGWSAVQARKWRTVWQTFLLILLIGLGTLLVFSLQLAVWYIFYGQPLTVPQETGFMDWRAPWIWPVLFSTFHGLLPWIPVTLPATIGLILLARRAPRLSVPLLVAFALQIYVNGCVRDWFGGGGYGARRFCSTIIILLIGYAYLLGWRKETWYRFLAAGISGLLVLHQWLILRYGFVDQIGGHVVSMYPTYEWREVGIVSFGQQLASYIPLAIQNPLQTLFLPNSPLETARTSLPSFAYQVLLLLGVLSVLYALRLGWRRLVPRQAGSATVHRLFLIVVVTLIALANWWFLTHA